MFDDNDEDDQTKQPRTRGNRPTDRTQDGPAATGAQPRPMPWERQGGAWGQPQGAPNGNTGVAGPWQGRPMQGGHPAFQWGGGGGAGGGFQPGGIMGGQGQGQGGMPNWQALAQQFMQRFQGNPMMQRLGMTGQGMRPPGQAPAAPPQGQPGGTPPIWAGPQAAPGMQPGAAPPGGPMQDRIGQLAALFGRQQPGGITGGPGQGQGY